MEEVEGEEGEGACLPCHLLLLLPGPLQNCCRSCCQVAVVAAAVEAQCPYRCCCLAWRVSLVAEAVVAAVELYFGPLLLLLLLPMIKAAVEQEGEA